MGARGFWAKVLGAALVAAPLAAVATTSSATAATTGVTSFSYVSQPGDYIGQGRSGTLSDPSQFRISGTAGLVTVGIDTGSEWWSVGLAAPRGQQLTTGAYENVTRAGFNTTYGGLDVSSTGRGCNEVKGRFTVHAISADTAGRITSLDATLTQFCDASTGGLTATVRYAAPAAAALVLTSSNPSTVADQPVTLTARVSPGTGAVSFVDGSTVIGQATADAAGLARFTTSRLAAGTHTLTAKQTTTTLRPGDPGGGRRRAVAVVRQPVRRLHRPGRDGEPRTAHLDRRPQRHRRVRDRLGRRTHQRRVVDPRRRRTAR